MLPTIPSKPEIVVKRRAIDEVLATLYADEVRGRLGLDAKTLKDAAFARIKRNIETLDKRARKTVEDDTNYRLDRFAEFSQISEAVRAEVLKVAKERRIGIEEAYLRVQERK